MPDIEWSYLQVLQSSGAELLQGLVVTLQLWLTSCALGFVLALVLALCSTMGNRYVQGLARAYIACIRGTPLLVQMFIWYYGLGQFEALRESIAWVVLEDAWCCGLLALTLNIAAYMAEDIRAGIQAVPTPHLEAAQAFGMAPWLIIRRILLPEALQIATPALGNEWVSQLKATALVSTITVLDMTGVARRLSIESYTTDALVVAGMIYAVLTLLISGGIRMLERKHRRHAPGQRR
jgi:putative lysine/arginine/ornithine/histidine/octopine transport system permease protein